MNIATIVLAIPLTLSVYWLALRVHHRFPIPLLNPVLVSMGVLIGLFLLMRPQLAAYQLGAQPLTWLLNPAVVALAVPLYKQLERVRRRFVPILASMFAAVLCSIVVGTLVARASGGSEQMAESLAPKAVTTPVAMALSASTGGVPSVTAAAVIFAGILGASLGFAFLRLLGVKSDEGIGVAIGAASHALGTARCSEVGQERGAFSSLSLVVCAILTSLAVPLLVPWLLQLTL